MLRASLRASRVRSATRPRATLNVVSWEPTEQEIEEKLIQLAYAWGDIEEQIEKEALASDTKANFNSSMLHEAFRTRRRDARLRRTLATAGSSTT